jgi:cytochrome c oxidase cbb3-type subunit 3
MMPAFGADGLLDDEQIDQVVAYVLSLGEREHDAGAATEGAVIYEENCAACHGEEGMGDIYAGAPNLADAIWLYGGEPEQIASQIHNPKHGVMPPWQGRLDESTIKMLTVYVHGLGGGQVEAE